MECMLHSTEACVVCPCETPGDGNVLFIKCLPGSCLFVPVGFGCQVVAFYAALGVGEVEADMTEAVTVGVGLDDLFEDVGDDGVVGAGAVEGEDGAVVECGFAFDHEFAASVAEEGVEGGTLALVVLDGSLLIGLGRGEVGRGG